MTPLSLAETSTSTLSLTTLFVVKNITSYAQPTIQTSECSTKDHGTATNHASAIRQAVRVLLCSAGKILLLRCHDVHDFSHFWWVTPGGGLQAGESYLDAAIREVREETGLCLALSDLHGPVARRFVTHGVRFSIGAQEEVYYLVRLDDAISSTPLTSHELPTEDDYAWLTPSDLAADPTMPREIVPLITGSNTCCVILHPVHYE